MRIGDPKTNGGPHPFGLASVWEPRWARIERFLHGVLEILGAAGVGALVLFTPTPWGTLVRVLALLALARVLLGRFLDVVDPR